MIYSLHSIETCGENGSQTTRFWWTSWFGKQSSRDGQRDWGHKKGVWTSNTISETGESIEGILVYFSFVDFPFSKNSLIITRLYANLTIFSVSFTLY